MSTLATMCVTLMLSGWLRHESASEATSGGGLTSLAAPAPVLSSGAAVAHVIEISHEAKTAAAPSSAPTATSDKVAVANGADRLPAASVQPVGGRPSRPPRGTARDAKPSCGGSCSGPSTIAAGNVLPPSRPPSLDVQPVALATVALEAQRPQFAVGAPVPPLPKPPAALHSALLVLEGASAVADILSRLVGKF